MRTLSEIPEGLLSIESYLDPAWLKPGTLETIKARLKSGALVVVRDAFRRAFAERMYECLDICEAWKLYEGTENYFRYHHHNLYDQSDYPPDLAWCERIFSSKSSRDFASRLSERDCRGSVALSASWYLPGDYSLPHDDSVSHGKDLHRQVAFIWHLTKSWRPEWGGALYWCPRRMYIQPEFNSLILFNVRANYTAHFVTAVSPYACSKRLTVNGWWTGSDQIESPKPVVDLIRTDSSQIEIY